MYSSDFTGVGSHSSTPLLCVTDETSQTNGSATCPDISTANTPPCSNPDASSPSTQVMEITVKQEEEELCERPLKRLRTDTEPSSEGPVPHSKTETVWLTSRNLRSGLDTGPVFSMKVAEMCVCEFQGCKWSTFLSSHITAAELSSYLKHSW